MHIMHTYWYNVYSKADYFFPSGETLSEWHLCLNGNIASCGFWSLLSLLNATEDHIKIIESLYLAELGLLWSFGDRRHIIARPLLVWRPWSVSVANALKSSLYKVVFWSTIWFSWKSAFSFLRKKKDIKATAVEDTHHRSAGVQHYVAADTEVKIQRWK